MARKRDRYIVITSYIAEKEVEEETPKSRSGSLTLFSTMMLLYMYMRRNTSAALELNRCFITSPMSIISDNQ